MKIHLQYYGKSRPSYFHNTNGFENSFKKNLKINKIKK